MYHNILQCITIYYNISQYITIYHNILQYIAIYQNISQYITAKRLTGSQDRLRSITMFCYRRYRYHTVAREGSALEFWNSVDTYNPDIIIGMESWLREEIENTEIFRTDFTTFRRDRHERDGGVFVLTIIMPARSYGLTTNSR